MSASVMHCHMSREDSVMGWCPWRYNKPATRGSSKHTENGYQECNRLTCRVIVCPKMVAKMVWACLSFLNVVSLFWAVVMQFCRWPAAATSVQFVQMSAFMLVSMLSLFYISHFYLVVVSLQFLGLI